MKKILLPFLLLSYVVSFGQTTDATLTVQAQQIKNETVAGANTATRVGTHLQNLVYSKKSFFIDGTASGTDTYAVTLDNGAIVSLASQWFVVKFTNANSGAATLNINATGAVPLVKTDGSALSSGDIAAGSMHLLSHDGSSFQVLSLGGSGSAGTVTSVGLTAGTSGTDVAVSGSPVTSSGSFTLNIPTSSASNRGALSSTDWSTFNAKQAALVSGTNIKTINGTTILGSGDLTIGGSVAWGAITGTLSAQTDLQSALDAKVSASITDGVTSSAPDQNQVFDALALKANKALTHNLQTGSTYIPVLTDADSKMVIMRSASAQTVTLQQFSDVAFTAGTRIAFVQDSTGLLTFAEGTNVNIESSSGLLTAPCQDCPIIAEKKNTTGSWFLWNGSPAGLDVGTITKADDTNVTLTLGGTPINSTFNDVSFSLGWTGTLAVDRGGTAANNTTQTYTPTLTNSANLDGSTAQICQYFRIGNVVTVSGTLSVNPTTTATLTTLGISLPIASDFATAVQAGGTAAATAVTDAPAGIISDATNNRVTLSYICVDVSSHVMSFTFTYQVL